MEHRALPGMPDVSAAHAGLRRDEMARFVEAGRLGRPGDRLLGWLPRAAARGLVSLGNLLVDLGEWLVESSQPVVVSGRDGAGC